MKYTWDKLHSKIPWIGDYTAFHVTAHITTSCHSLRNRIKSWLFCIHHEHSKCFMTEKQQSSRVKRQEACNCNVGMGLLLKEKLLFPVWFSSVCIHSKIHAELISHTSQKYSLICLNNFIVLFSKFLEMPSLCNMLKTHEISFEFSHFLFVASHSTAVHPSALRWDLSNFKFHLLKLTGKNKEEAYKSKG